MQTGADSTLLLKKTEEAKKAAAILAEQVRDVYKRQRNPGAQENNP